MIVCSPDLWSMNGLLMDVLGVDVCVYDRGGGDEWTETDKHTEQSNVSEHPLF